MPDFVKLRSSYFFLSYAHSPPLAGTPQAGPDRWVRTFYRDLTDAIDRLAPGRGDIGQGFLDQEIPLGSSWRTAFAQALSAAEVFVPLYSPGYFERSWPGREWECFRRRVTAAGVSNYLERFAPVLWIPLRPDERPDGLEQALALGAAESAYAQNGLRALLRLAPYRASYWRIVERLAGQIAELAEKSPLAPSAAPDIEQVQSPFRSKYSVVFMIALATGSRSGALSGGDPVAHVENPVPWRPFPEIQEASLAEYAVTQAEQLDFAAVAVRLDQAEGQFGRSPGVILIDPWYIAGETGLRELSRIARRLPPWVLPVLVVDPGADRREAELAQQVRTILDEAHRARTEMASQAAAGVTSLEQFVTLMPFLIAEAERQYLRGGPTTRSTVPTGSRPRLFGGEWMASPAADSPKGDLDD